MGMGISTYAIPIGVNEGLQGEGFSEIRTCVDGEAAIREIEAYKPHIIILSQMLKHMDGISVMEYISNYKLDISVILTTTHLSHVLAHRAAELDVQYILLRPVYQDVVISRVKDVISLKELDKKKRIDEDEKIQEEFKLEVELLHIASEEELENNVGRILLNIGIQSHLKGYKYLKIAITMTLIDEYITNSITGNCIHY